MDQVVAIVPVESILYSIATSQREIALQCCDALHSRQIEIPPSETMLKGLHLASIQLADDCQDLSGISLARKEAQKAYRKHISKSSQLVEKAHSVPAISEAVERRHFFRHHEILVNIDVLNYIATQGSLPPTRYLAQMLLNACVPTVDDKQLDAICGENLQCVYPMTTSSEDGSIHSLKSPLQILSEGRKKLSWLAQHAIDASQTEAESLANTDESNTSLSSLYNAKMLQVVNDI